MTTLSLHLSRHAYEKGAYQGDAPADPSRRHKTHFRVLQDARSVLFYSTVILDVCPDTGIITLNSGGWIDSPTTREAIHYALTRYTDHPFSRAHLRRWGGKPTQYTIFGTKFHDGMRIAPDGHCLNPMPFVKQVADRERRKAYRTLMQEFLHVLPVLYPDQRPPHNQPTVVNPWAKPPTPRLISQFEAVALDPTVWHLAAADLRRRFPDYQDARAYVLNAANALTKLETLS